MSLCTDSLATHRPWMPRVPARTIGGRRAARRWSGDSEWFPCPLLNDVAGRQSLARDELAALDLAGLDVDQCAEQRRLLVFAAGVDHDSAALAGHPPALVDVPVQAEQWLVRRD